MRVRFLAAPALVVMIVSHAAAGIVEDGLVSYWRFEAVDKREDGYRDLRGSNHATLVGEPETSEGKFGDALLLDGVDDYAEVADDESLHLWEAHTLEAWVYVNEVRASRILDKITVSTADGPHLDLFPTGALRSCAGTCVVGEEAVPAETWTHVAVTYDGGTVTLYVNGEAGGSGSAASPLPGNALPLRIGADSNGEGLFSGRIDEVRVYDRALSADEVAQNHDADRPLDKVNPDSKIKPYDEVITEDAESQEGVFTVHKVWDKWYYEIPPDELGRLFLWVSSVAKTQTGVGFGGRTQNAVVVRWDRREDQVLLRLMQYRIVADEEKTVYNAVEASSYPAIIRAFDVLAIGDDDSVVIEVGDLFTSDMKEFSPKSDVGGEALDGDRSFVERVTPYPENIEAEAVLTFRADSPGGAWRLGAVSVVMHHSMVHLPDEPMMPRLWDSRVGFFSMSQEDYGRDEHRLRARRYISRWRLEKKDPTAELSDPVKPIVFYIDRGVPEKWKPYLKQGVDDWQVAFEAAGFSNAIMGKYAPTVEEDPDWSSEDARYSSIRWWPTPMQNAFGPHVSDPRTGEILEADVVFFHNITELARDWYFSQVGPLDPRAATLPFPDDLMGELLRYVAAHEVGHSVGLPHNMKASSSYPVEMLRDAEFTRENGHVASIMDYARFNYVAQPGDGARLIPIVGPYDKFAIRWGYMPIADAETPDDERPTLHALASEQSDDPVLRFGSRSYHDPSAQTEDIGADPIEATRYGLMNIDRAADMLIPATTTHPGDDYDELRNMYNEVLGQRNRELGHVVGLIAGVTRTDYHVGQEGLVFDVVPREKQLEAMRFLVEHAFTTPTKLLNPDILDRIEPAGNVDRVVGSQTGVLARLLDEGRAKRLIDQEAAAAPGETPYSLNEMLSELRAGIWSELDAEAVEVDAYRRALQRAHIEQLGRKLDPDGPSKSDMRPLARGELVALSAAIAAALDRTAHWTTQLHLEDARVTIDHILNPR
ncbi:DUF5117 domain-containing protein [Candidatus Poribacteria bacterium]|jgi:hypothetical protein|nr:DUF5117 domain-containing protein [Candidatus Poribacteria bacterium]MBT5532045.1 DUF5117 domain-containing protein [Candidatus Poribacteria bacterium]MBT7809429.1 DUF5117 domain-containing protein [Candidatus Poribacteria bacterium]